MTLNTDPKLTDKEKIAKLEAEILEMRNKIQALFLSVQNPKHGHVECYKCGNEEASGLIPIDSHDRTDRIWEHGFVCKDYCEKSVNTFGKNQLRLI